MKTHAAIIIKDENKFLFVQRSLNKKTLPGIWSFPSGTQEIGEDIKITAQREAQEELGINVVPERILTNLELPELSVELSFVLCKIANGQPYIKEPNEIGEFRWMTFREFFESFSDKEIGHGLVWLRKNPEVISKI